MGGSSRNKKRHPGFLKLFDFLLKLKMNKGHSQQYRSMGVQILCDRCQEEFDDDNRCPYILPDCGHTLCSLCIQELLQHKDGNRKCFTCQTRIGLDHALSAFKTNFKLLSLMINPNTTPGMGKNNLTMELINSVSCPRHQDRPIAYFCKSCNEAVCVDCIFDSHNGHLLMNIGEMCKIASQ